jgi:hypothetical protein
MSDALTVPSTAVDCTRIGLGTTRLTPAPMSVTDEWRLHERLLIDVAHRTRTKALR